MLLNNPLNPSATVFPDEDLALLAGFCERFDAVALCDEVWEHVVFDGRRHTPLMAFPVMRERTVKIGSAGKIFSLTGWKVGFVMAAPGLMRGLAKAHQFLTFTTPPNLQAAVAYGLGKEDYLTTRACGPTSPGPATASPTGSRASASGCCRPPAPTSSTSTSRRWARATTWRSASGWCGSTASRRSPVSAFYAHRPVRTIVRFCFAKRDDHPSTGRWSACAGSRPGRAA